MTQNSERISLLFFILGIICIITSIIIIEVGILNLESIDIYIIGSVLSAIIGAVFFILGAKYTPDLRNKQSGDSVV